MKRERVMNKRLHYICYDMFFGIIAVFLSFVTNQTTAMAEQPTCEIKYTVFLPTFMFKDYSSIVKKAQKIVQNTTLTAPNCDTVRKTVLDMSKLSEDYLEMIVSGYNTPKSKVHTNTIIKLNGTYIKIHILKDGLYAHVQIAMASVLEVRRAIDAEKDADFRGNGPFVVCLYD